MVPRDPQPRVRESIHLTTGRLDDVAPRHEERGRGEDHEQAAGERERCRTEPAGRASASRDVAPGAAPIAADDAGRFTAAAAFGFFGSARFAAAVPRFFPSESVFFAVDFGAFVSPAVAFPAEALSVAALWVADFTLPPLVAPATDFAPAPDRPAS